MSTPLQQMVLAAFVVVGVLFVVVVLASTWVLAPKRDSEEKDTTYECGVDPIGPPWVQFKVGYYVYALLFVVFDIETAFLYPWAVAFGRGDLFILVEMVIFVAILAFGLAYAWKEGALRWR